MNLPIPYPKPLYLFLNKHYLLLILLLVGLLGSLPLVAQSPELDSMRRVLSDQSGREKAKTLLTLCGKLKRKEKKVGKSCCLQGLKIAEGLNDTIMKWLGHVDVVYYYRMRAVYDSAIFHATKALEYSDQLGIPMTQRASANELGKVYNAMADPEKALPYNKLALEYAHAEGSLSRICGVQLSIGNTFYDLYGETKARNYLDSTEAYYQQAMDGYLVVGDTSGYLAVLGNMSNVYRRKGQHQKSLEINLEELEFRKKEKDTTLQMYCLMGAGAALVRLDRVREAIPLFESGLELAELSGDLESQSQLLSNLIDSYDLIGNYKEESRMWNRMAKLDSFLFSEDMRETSLALEAKYRGEKNGRELAEQKIINQEIENRNRQIWIASLVGFLGLVIAGFVWRYINKNREELRVQKLMTEQQKKRFAAVVKAEEEERGRIARELHDGLGQLLSTAKMNVASLDEAIESGGDAHDSQSWKGSMDLIDEAATEVRHISHNLMPYALIESGLIPALKELERKVNAGRSAPLLEVISEDFVGRMEKEKEISLYRIAQELINNSLKHSEASSLRLNVSTDGSETIMYYRDNGKGFELEQLEQSSGIGWRNIKSRLELMEGTISFDHNTPGEPTTIQIKI
ncbi:MAG: sensor histidine kinase [Bacteroidota bacterium]